MEVIIQWQRTKVDNINIRTMQENFKITGATNSEGKLYFKLKYSTSVGWYEVTNFSIKDAGNYIVFSTPHMGF